MTGIFTMGRPQFVMMIGVPGCGKTTYRLEHYPDYKIVSTDSFLEEVAAKEGKTYNEVFEEHIKAATAQMNKDLDVFIKNRDNIVWDQTNLTVNSRIRKMNRIPRYYHRVAVVFKVPIEVVEQRIIKRYTETGKDIPHAVFDSMLRLFEDVKPYEAYDEVIYVC